MQISLEEKINTLKSRIIHGEERIKQEVWPDIDGDEENFIAREGQRHALVGTKRKLQMLIGN